MDRNQYLNQISTKHTPVKKSKLDSVLHSKFTWIILAVIVLLVIIMGAGSAISGNRVPTSDRLYELLLRVDTVKEAVDTYQPSIKSSELRGYSASLSSILSNTSRDLTDYVTTAYNYKKVDDIKPSIQSKVATEQEELNDALQTAKITATLDRVFAHKVAYEISLITNSEEAILATHPDETIDKSLNTSYNSLIKLYPEFDNFTEG